MLYEEQKLNLIYLARRAHDTELSRDGFGSISILLPLNKEIIITPANVKAYDLRPDDIILISREGDIAENPKNHKLPRMLDLHLVAYKEREGTIDVVLHINPMNATMRANEGNRVILLSDYINPAESENGDIASLIKTPIKYRDCMLIKNNGVLVVGKGIFDTLEKAEYIETISIIKMPKEEIYDLEALKKYNEQQKTNNNSQNIED